MGEDEKGGNGTLSAFRGTSRRILCSECRNWITVFAPVAMLLNGDPASSSQAPHPPSASVKLRRRNRQQSSSTPDAAKKKVICVSLIHS